MSYKIKPTFVARKETEEAVYYYESIHKGLGISFLNELEKKYKSLSRNPFAFSYIDNKNIIRDVKVNRFPYVIIYKIEAELVIVLSVHHTSKNSEF